MNSLRLQLTAPIPEARLLARDFPLLISDLCSLISKRIALWLLSGIGAVQSLTKLAAVNLRFGPDDHGHFFRIVVPPFQMTCAELALLVLFVACTLLRLARFDFGSGCGFFCHGVLSTNRGHGKTFSERYVRSATLRPHRRRIQIAGRRRQRAPNRRHNDTTMVFRCAASCLRRCIWFAPFPSVLRGHASGPSRSHRNRRVALRQLQNS